MATGNFKPSLKIVLENESGFVDNADHQKCSNLGITKQEYEDHMNKVITKDKVKAFTENDVASVYKMYWELMKCNDLPKGMDLCVFDFAVYREPKIAQRELQYVLGAKRDTWSGPITIGLLENMVAEKGISATIDTYQDHRKAWIDKLTSATESEKNTFKARVDTITAAAKGMV